MHFNYDVVMIPLQLIIVFFTIYYFVVSWFGLFGKMRETKQFPEKSTFALIVCAHNEQQVIAKLVENLKQLNYSDKLYDIFVVADNCVDKTAEAARNAGAIVYERFSETGKGKGNPMYRYPVIIAVLIGAYLLWQKPSGWPFVGMFTYFIAGVINAVYCMLFVKEE